MAARYNQQFDECLEKFLSHKNYFTNVLELIEGKTNVKRVYIVKAILGVFALYMIFGHFAALVCNLIGFVYPAYASIHALESRNKDDDTKWLTYWVVFANFSVVEFWSDVIFSWFPLYWLAKIVFLVWCFAPVQNNGSVFVYSRIIRRFFLSNKNRIDEATSKIAEEVSKLTKSD